MVVPTKTPPKNSDLYEASEIYGRNRKTTNKNVFCEIASEMDISHGYHRSLERIYAVCVCVCSQRSLVHHGPKLTRSIVFGVIVKRRKWEAALGTLTYVRCIQTVL
jgi:hypothetical protein